MFNPLLKCGFCCAHNRPINFGEILMKVIINKLGPVKNRNVQNNAKVDCFYPRFFMLFLNDKMSQEDKIFYMNSDNSFRQSTIKGISVCLRCLRVTYELSGMFSLIQWRKFLLPLTEETLAIYLPSYRSLDSVLHIIVLSISGRFF